MNGRGPGAAEIDPFGWTCATSSANSSRGNKFLVLWDTKGEDSPEGHFDPEDEQVKGFLARIWLYMRATYGGGEFAYTLDLCSVEQKNHAEDILKVASETDLTDAQKGWHKALCDKVLQDYEVVWRNPLFDEDKTKVDAWLTNDDWKRLVFC